MVTVNTITCPKCHDTIYSRATHDFHKCSCGAIAIDGGFEYMRMSYAIDIVADDVKHGELELQLTKQELYNDWNKQTDKYGIIKGAK